MPAKLGRLVGIDLDHFSNETKYLRYRYSCTVYPWFQISNRPNLKKWKILLYFVLDNTLVNA